MSSRDAVESAVEWGRWKLGFSTRLTGTGERADVYVPGYARGMLYARKEDK